MTCLSANAATTLLLLRHGEIPQAAPSRFVGQRDLPLTERGQAQAQAWSRHLAALPLASAWCSDLVRCRHTAALALAGAPLAATTLPALREIHLGGWEGLTVDEVRQRFPGEHEKRGADLAHTIPSGGESFAQAQHRFWDALTHIARQGPGLALVVAHGGVIRAALCRLLGLRLDSLFRLGQDYCGLNIVTFPAPGDAHVRAMNLAPIDAAGMLEELRTG
ncbi:MAG: histidine phosphatase family protein [Desulfovibrio sp.]